MRLKELKQPGSKARIGFPHLVEIVQEGASTKEGAYTTLIDKTLVKMKEHPQRERYYERLTWITEHEHELKQIFSEMLVSWKVRRSDG